MCLIMSDLVYIVFIKKLVLQMLPSPSPSLSGQLSQLGASLYGPQSEYMSSIWLILSRCASHKSTLHSDSEHHLISVS